MSQRSPYKVRKTVEVSQDDYEWYIETHHVTDDTNRTGFSALINLLLHSFREVCEEDKVDFKELTKKAARITKEEFE